MFPTLRNPLQIILRGAILILAAIATAAPASSAAPLSTEQFLAQARAVHATLPPFACDVETQEYFGAAAPVSTEGDPQQKTTYHVRSAGERFDVLTTSYAPEPESGKLAPTLNSRSFWDGALLWRTTELLVPGPEVAVQVDESEYYLGRLHANPNMGGFLDGYLMHHYGGNWVTLLEKEPSSTLEQETQEVDGHTCYVLRAATPHGRYRLWVDAEHGYRVRRGEVTVERGQQAWGSPLQQAGMSTPGRTFERFEMEISDVKLEDFGGYWFGTAGKFVHRFHYSDGSVSSNTLLVRRTNFAVNPDFSALGAFDVALAEGDKVEYTFKNGAMLDYRWVEGRLAPVMDETTVAAIDRAADGLRENADRSGTLASLQPQEITPASTYQSFANAAMAALNLFQNLWVFAGLLLLLAITAAAPPVRRWLAQ